MYQIHENKNGFYEVRDGDFIVYNKFETFGDAERAIRRYIAGKEAIAAENLRLRYIARRKD